MEFSKIAGVCHRWNFQFFRCAIEAGIVVRTYNDSTIGFDNDLYSYKKTDFWKSNGGMGINSSYDIFCGRNSTLLFRDHGTVYS